MTASVAVIGGWSSGARDAVLAIAGAGIPVQLYELTEPFVAEENEDHPVNAPLPGVEVTNVWTAWDGSDSAAGFLGQVLTTLDAGPDAVVVLCGWGAVLNASLGRETIEVMEAGAGGTLIAIEGAESAADQVVRWMRRWWRQRRPQRTALRLVRAPDPFGTEPAGAPVARYRRPASLPARTGEALRRSGYTGRRSPPVTGWPGPGGPRGPTCWPGRCGSRGPGRSSTAGWWSWPTGPSPRTGRHPPLRSVPA